MDEDRRIELRTSGVLNVFRVQGAWPPSAADKSKILDDLYKDLEAREQQDLERMKQVTDLITGAACFARTLAKHFGDALPNDAKECGHCSWCETKTAVPKVNAPPRQWDSHAFFKMLAACPERDDPRYLARVAFGITSPRITAAKLTNTEIFGSMCDHDFTALLTAFTKICDKEPARQVAGIGAETASTQPARKTTSIPAKRTTKSISRSHTKKIRGSFSSSCSVVRAQHQLHRVNVRLEEAQHFLRRANLMAEGQITSEVDTVRQSCAKLRKQFCRALAYESIDLHQHPHFSWYISAQHA